MIYFDTNDCEPTLNFNLDLFEINQLLFSVKLEPFKITHRPVNKIITDRLLFSINSKSKYKLYESVYSGMSNKDGDQVVSHKQRINIDHFYIVEPIVINF